MKTWNVWIHPGQGACDPWICQVNAEDKETAAKLAIGVMIEKRLWLGEEMRAQGINDLSSVGIVYEAVTPMGTCSQCGKDLLSPYVLDLAEAKFCDPTCGYEYWSDVQEKEERAPKEPEKFHVSPCCSADMIDRYGESSICLGCGSEVKDVE
jgi:hypothetical protein